jgi:osmotically-inducible protein OsmY
MNKRWLGLGLALFLCGCGNQDVECLGRVCRKTAGKLDTLTGGAREKLADGWQAVRAAWGEATLDSRVATRLRWDKALTDAEVKVSATGPGTVQLQGTVADLAEKQRAVELANSTQGVEKVEDLLEVRGAEK